MAQLWKAPTWTAVAPPTPVAVNCCGWPTEMVGFGGATVMACAATSALPSASPRLTIPNRMKGSLSSRALLGCIIREIPNARWSPIFRRAGLRTRDCAGLKDEDARSSGRRGRSQGAPRQIDDDVLGADRGKGERRLPAGASDYQDFRVVEELLDVLAHQRRDVGDLLFDVATIGADQSRERDARVEDSHLASLADECLDQRDHRTLPEVVGPRLEGQADDSHTALPGLEHPVYPSTNLRLVGGKDRGEHLRRHISRASGIEQRPKV